MKKLISLICVSFVTLATMGQSVSQTDNSVIALSAPLKQLGNNEISLNLLNSVIGAPEISYERFIADNMGVGISAALSVDNTDNIGYHWALTPFYRLYFGNKKAAGFFLEGNMALVNQRFYNTNSSFDNNGNPVSNEGRGTSTNFGLGMAGGWKFLTRNGFMGEVHLGLGRLLGCNPNYNLVDAYPRIGISIGKRF